MWVEVDAFGRSKIVFLLDGRTREGWTRWFGAKDEAFDDDGGVDHAEMEGVWAGLVDRNGGGDASDAVADGFLPVGLAIGELSVRRPYVECGEWCVVEA
jgi:hypothetical protein